MKVELTYDKKLSEVKFIETQEHYDERGFFSTLWNTELFDIYTPGFKPIQENLSFSNYGTIRGVHYQEEPYAQAKLVRCLSGGIIDFYIDLRPDSPTFGVASSVALKRPSQSVLIPKGFGHGFQVVTTQGAIVQYLVDNRYKPQSENGINVETPQIKELLFQSLYRDFATVSHKDKQWRKLND